MRAIVLHFNFGYSYQVSQPVKTLIFNRLPATISLTVGAVVIWMSIGMTVGAISAVRQRSLLDRLTIFGSLLAISVPTFWLALLGLSGHPQRGSTDHPGNGAVRGFLHRNRNSHRGCRLRISRPTGPLLMSPLLVSNGAGSFNSEHNGVNRHLPRADARPAGVPG
jgi:hypothetical protein